MPFALCCSWWPWRWTRWWGEPPARVHPVVWMGSLPAAGRCLAAAAGRARPPVRDFRLLAGALLDCRRGHGFGSGVVAAGDAGVALPWWAQALALGVLLKPMLAWAHAGDEVRAVEAALGESLDRRARAPALAGEPRCNALTKPQVRESAIETLAENLNDSVVAPLFWFVLLGLPGAALYRFANTADAMWGYPGSYRGRNWAWAGKWAARADDVWAGCPRASRRLLLGGLVTAVPYWRACAPRPPDAVTQQRLSQYDKEKNSDSLHWLKFHKKIRFKIPFLGVFLRSGRVYSTGFYRAVFARP